MEQPKRLAIIGAGPVGYTLGMLLAMKGYEIDVFERRSNPLEEGETYFSRTVNMMINARVHAAWKKIGVFDEIFMDQGPLKYFKYHLDTGENVTYHCAGKDDILWAVRRQYIIMVLSRKAATFPNLKINYQTRVDNVDL